MRRRWEGGRVQWSVMAEDEEEIWDGERVQWSVMAEDEEEMGGGEGTVVSDGRR